MITVADLLRAIEDAQSQRAIENPKNYSRITLMSSGQDCDGPFNHSERSYFVTEEESRVLLVDHFGFSGWACTWNERDQACMFTRQDALSDGYMNLSASIFFPMSSDLTSTE